MAPIDDPRVLEAVRLGWAFAETRGRLRLPPEPQPAPRPEHALPLGDERTWNEQTIETQMIVTSLAEGLGLNFPLALLTGRHGQDGTASSHLDGLADALGNARRSDDGARLGVRLDELCEFFYAWDARIQDTLAADSFAVASGYQLGRGLAESYWALDRTIDDRADPRSWMFLLGDGRMKAFERMLPRLASYFPASTTPAVLASLSAWSQVAANQSVRQLPATASALHEQVRLWHDLVLVGQTPASRIEPKSLLRRARKLGPVLTAFIPEISVAVLSLLAAGGAAVLFSTGKGNTALAPLLAVVSAFGVTAAGALAKAKDEAHALFSELRDAMNEDLIKEAITLPPASFYLDSGGRRARRRRRRTLRALEPA
jgi:hypothetical protein